MGRSFILHKEPSDKSSGLVCSGRWSELDKGRFVVGAESGDHVRARDQLAPVDRLAEQGAELIFAQQLPSAPHFLTVS